MGLKLNKEWIKCYPLVFVILDPWRSGRVFSIKWRVSALSITYTSSVVGKSFPSTILQWW